MNSKDDIRELCYLYTFLLDDGDFGGVGALLAHATLRPTMPGVAGVDITGEAAIAAFYAEQVVTYSRGRPMTRHLVTNQIITVSSEGETASSRSYFTVLQRAPGYDFHIVVGGQYQDAFECIRGEWRFTRKDIQVDHLNDIENHFRISPDRSR